MELIKFRRSIIILADSLCAESLNRPNQKKTRTRPPHRIEKLSIVFCKPICPGTRVVSLSISQSAVCICRPEGPQTQRTILKPVHPKRYNFNSLNSTPECPNALNAILPRPLFRTPLCVAKASQEGAEEGAFKESEGRPHSIFGAV